MSYTLKEIFYTLQGEGANTGRPAVFCRFAGCNLWSGLERDRATAVCRFCDTDFVGVDGPGGGRFATAGDLAAAVAAAWPVPRPGTAGELVAPTFRSASERQRTIEQASGTGCIDVPTPTGRSALPTLRPYPDARTGIGAPLEHHHTRSSPHPDAGGTPALPARDPRPVARNPGRPLVVCTGGEPLLQMDEPLVESLHEVGFEVAIETNGTRLPPPGVDWICVSPKAGADLVLTAGHELKLVYPQAGAEPERFEELDFAHFYLQPMDGPERERNTQAALRYCLDHPRWRLSLQTHKLLGIP